MRNIINDGVEASARKSQARFHIIQVSVMVHFMFVHYTFSSVWVVEWPAFWK